MPKETKSIDEQADDFIDAIEQLIDARIDYYHMSDDYKFNTDTNKAKERLKYSLLKG